MGRGRRGFSGLRGVWEGEEAAKGRAGGGWEGIEGGRGRRGSLGLIGVWEGLEGGRGRAGGEWRSY